MANTVRAVLILILLLTVPSLGQVSRKSYDELVAAHDPGIQNSLNNYNGNMGNTVVAYVCFDPTEDKFSIVSFMLPDPEAWEKQTDPPHHEQQMSPGMIIDTYTNGITTDSVASGSAIWERYRPPGSHGTYRGKLVSVDGNEEREKASDFSVSDDVVSYRYEFPNQAGSVSKIEFSLQRSTGRFQEIRTLPHRTLVTHGRCIKHTREKP